MAQERKAIIRQITTLYPVIPKKTVFYTTCKYEKDCFANPRVFTFQSGVGQMLLVLYGAKVKFFTPLLGGLYLWDWDAEDYKEVNGYAFGYFRDLKKVESLVRDGKILPDEIVALSYDKSKNKVEDISEETRKKITLGVK